MPVHAFMCAYRICPNNLDTLSISIEDPAVQNSIYPTRECDNKVQKVQTLIRLLLRSSLITVYTFCLGGCPNLLSKHRTSLQAY